MGRGRFFKKETQYKKKWSSSLGVYTKRMDNQVFKKKKKRKQNKKELSLVTQALHHLPQESD